MGRLQALTTLLGAAVLATGCDIEGKATVTVTKARQEAVQATGTAPTAPPAPTKETVAPVRAPRKLCEGQLAKPGRDLPRQNPSRMAAPGERPPSASIPTGGGYTWINLWAAWCVPCKEELPRLWSFASRLKQAGQTMNLVFVSLDDDERQLETFLQAQPTGGLRSTYWLREGHERDAWLSQVGIAKDPQLPVQLVVDRRGKVRCVIGGAVEEEDFAEVRAIVAAN